MDFITIADQIDEEDVALTARETAEANRYCAGVVRKCGRDPEDDALPLDDLRDLALAHAYYLAYGYGMVGQDSEHEAKSKFYCGLYKKRESDILSTLPAPDGVSAIVSGSVEIGRG